MEFDEAWRAVRDLADLFHANQTRYLSPDYREAEVRKDFIDKFWIALGWDVNHDEQTNPYEQEVKVERSVATGATQRRADYAFYLAPNFRDPRFYVEAKKPTASMATAENYFQAVRYGWNSRTPLVVLTDFRHFDVLDCRHKPEVDSALKRAIATYRYTDYPDRDAFGRIYWLFSREAVAGAAWRQHVQELLKPGGKAAAPLPRDQPVDEAFLEELDDFRAVLARAFKRRNPQLDGETLTELTQRTLDRLVFIRFLEDRDIEPRRLVDGFGRSGSAWQDFVAASRRLDGTYNGAVFKRHALLDDRELQVDDVAFTGICARLTARDTPYDFNSIPIHILGSIYERFLGKAIVATDKRVRIDPRRQAGKVRKAGGVYYTREYVVRYIVEHTVGRLVEGRTPEQIAGMKFADIACGSGSFLLGIYDYLLEYHGNYYNRHRRKASRADCVEREGRLYLSYSTKRRILLNNVYGVDLDPQAVEVAQLSLYLRLLKEETSASTHQYQLDFAHDARVKKLLPDLSRNVVCGNSLVGTDVLDGELFPKTDERRVHPMDFEQRFPEALRRGGFDAVVGNPPYVLMQDEFRNDVLLAYLRRRYSVASYKVDTYHLFMQRGIELTREGGRCALITPANFLTNNHLAGLRRFLLEQSQLDHVVVIDGGVFPDAAVDNAIFVTTRGRGGGGTFVLSHAVPGPDGLRESSRVTVVSREVLLDEQALFHGRRDEAESALWRRIRTLGRPLGAVAHVNFGKQLRDRKQFTRDVIELASLRDVPAGYRPCYTGRDVSRYRLTWGRLACLTSDVAQRGGCWDPSRQDAKGKLIARQIGAWPEFARDGAGFQCLNTVFMVNVHARGLDPRFVLGVLNSRLLRCFWLRHFRDPRRTFPKIKGTYLEQLPLRVPDPAIPAEKAWHDELVRRVDEIVAATELLARAKTDRDKDFYQGKCAALDQRIDSLVYGLYGLTSDEVALVESAAGDAVQSG